jgi:hypothetical protein
LPQLVRIRLQTKGSVDWPPLEIPLRVGPMKNDVMRVDMRGGTLR